MKKILILQLALLCTLVTSLFTLNSCMHFHTYGEWVTEKNASCEEAGIKVRTCECCETETQEISKLDHSFSEWVCVKNATCGEDGLQERVCSCGAKEESSIKKTELHSYGEWSIGAEPTVDGLGWKCRTCTVCQSQDLETIKQLSPISITSHTYTIDSVGGVEWKTEIRNNTTSTIKYITLKWTCYNAVNDVIYDQIDGKNHVKIQCTGPFEGETTKVYRNATKFYNGTYDHSVFNEITVEFMNGKIVTITDEEYADIFKKTELTLPSFPLDIYTASNEKYCSITNLTAEICDIDGKGVKNDILIKNFQGSYDSWDTPRRKARMRLIDSSGNVVYDWEIDGFGVRYYAYNCIEAGETYSIEFVYSEE